MIMDSNDDDDDELLRDNTFPDIATSVNESPVQPCLPLFPVRL